MRYTVTRVGLASVFKLSFVLATLAGLIVALLYSFLFTVISQLGSGLFGAEGNELFRLGGRIGILAVFFMGIFFAVLNGALSAAILTLMAAVYNAFAGWIGGLSIDLSPPRERHLPETVPPPVVPPDSSALPPGYPRASPPEDPTSSAPASSQPDIPE